MSGGHSLLMRTNIVIEFAFNLHVPSEVKQVTIKHLANLHLVLLLLLRKGEQKKGN